MLVASMLRSSGALCRSFARASSGSSHADFAKVSKVKSGVSARERIIHDLENNRVLLYMKVSVTASVRTDLTCVVQSQILTNLIPWYGPAVAYSIVFFFSDKTGYGAYRAPYLLLRYISFRIKELMCCLGHLFFCSFFHRNPQCPGLRLFLENCANFGRIGCTIQVTKCS